MEITGERVFSVGDEGTTKINGGRKMSKMQCMHYEIFKE